MGAYLCKMAIDGYGLRLDLTELCSGATAAICIRSLNESMRLQNGFGGNLGTNEWALEYGKRDSACTEHGLKDYKELAPKATSAFRRFRALSSQIKAVEKRMAKIAVLRTHILNYRKKQDVYVGYRQTGYSAKYYAAHEAKILLHKAAKKTFDEFDVKKLPAKTELDSKYTRPWFFCSSMARAFSVSSLPMPMMATLPL